VSHSTSGTLAFASHNLSILCLDLTVVVMLVGLIVSFQTRALAHERVLHDAHSASLRLQSIAYATEKHIDTPPTAVTVSAPRQLASVSETGAAVTTDHAAPPADLHELEDSIGWYEAQIARCRSKKRDSRWYEEHREALLKRRSELLTAVPNLAPARPATTEGY
jgi:hypothetical protein